MTSELICLLVLAALNIVQFGYWFFQTHRLIDKIMSKNYSEYVQAYELASRAPQFEHSVIDDEVTDDEVLAELNKSLGGGLQ